MTSGLARSVHTRLLRHAEEIGVDPNLIQTRYAAERFLYRLSRSDHADRFLLKGGLLLLVWLGEAIRPTRDVDLLGHGDFDGQALARIVRDICRVDVDPDGLEFDAESVVVRDIRRAHPYDGWRVKLSARLGNGRLRVQVDVGVGDSVFPDPVPLEYPVLLDLPPPRLRAYRPETAIAEKLHAMTILGSRNSRMRDFFDVWVLTRKKAFNGAELTEALVRTFARRGAEIPADIPLALTSEFADFRGKRMLWADFRRRNRLESAPEELSELIREVVEFLGPVLEAARQGERLDRRWMPEEGWRAS